MRSIKVIGLGIIAVLAMAVSASAASAAEFSYSAEVPTALLGAVVSGTAGVQNFTAGFGEVSCSTLEVVESNIVAKKAEKQEANIEYSKCTSPDGTVKEPIRAEYTFNANGNVTVRENISFTIEGLCTITVVPQEIKEAVSYGAKSVNLLVEAHAKNIKWNSGGNFLCGEGTEGTYKGSSIVMGANGGELEA